MKTLKNLTLLSLLVVLVYSCSEEPVTPVADEMNIPLQAQSLDDQAYLMGGQLIEFDDSEVFFEFNTTDNDLGLQIFLDGEDWERVRVIDPNRQKIVEVKAQGGLRDLGITELFFESAEPSPQEVLDLFDPGEYHFQGVTTEGDRLFGTGELSHDFLAPPVFSPRDFEEVDPRKVVVKWEVEDAEFVEVIIENEETDETFDVIVSGEVSSLTIPPQFLDYGMEYKLEILAIAENGNKTIAESFFVTKARAS